MLIIFWHEANDSKSIAGINKWYFNCIFIIVKI
jgi:hypothetical protein